MDLTQWLNDDRLLANLIGIHVFLAAVLVVAVILRKLLRNGSEQIGRLTGSQWLDGFSKDAVKSVRAILFWATVGLMVVSVVSMAAYHLSGRHIQEDLKDWYGQLTTAHLQAFGIMLAKLVGL